MGEFFSRLNGLKTYIVAGILILLGVAEYISITDISPFIMSAFGEKTGALLVILIPVVFGVLRYITNSPAAGRKKADDEGDVA
jgi:hypothetical protein